MINDVFYKIYPTEEINDIEINKYSNLTQKVNNNIGNKFDDRVGHKFGHRFGHRFRRSTVVYSFIDYIVKNVNLINCVSDEFKTE
jgi:hypothetical protein